MANKNYKNYLKGLEPLKYVILPFDEKDEKVLKRIKKNSKRVTKSK